jgi:ParB family chromosome partitioning protein
VDRVRPSPHQSRQLFDPAELEDLAASIQEYGVLQPVKVTYHADDGGGISYELIFGERRWRAAVQAGLDFVPAIVVSPDEVDDAGRTIQGLIENLHRADLNPMETLTGLKTLMALTDSSWSQLASLVRKSRRTLYYYRALDRMPEEVQELVASGQLAMKHVSALRAVEDADTQAQLVRAVVADGITGAALKEIVQSVKAGDAVQSAVIRAASRRLTPPPKPKPAEETAGEGKTETQVPRAEGRADDRVMGTVTALHEAAMVGLSDQQRADLSFEIRERELDIPDTRHAAAVMRRDPAKSAGAAVTYAQVLRNHPLYEPFKSLDFVLRAIAPLARADQPRAVRTVALAFLTEKEEELRAAIEALRSADIQAR